MLQMRHCSLEWTDSGARVVFPSGKEISAYPHPEEPHYHVISHRLGYGDGLTVYCREHELAHIVAAEEFKGEPSYVLEGLAHGMKLDPGLVLLEEMAAMTLQRWVRTNERPILAGCDWDRLMAVFLGNVAYLDREHAGRQAA